MNKIDTVLLDFDGTIMDTNEMIIKSWQYTFQRLRGEEADESEILATFGEPLKLTMHNFFGGDREEVEKNVEIYRSYQTKRYLDLIRLFPGVTEMLEDLRKGGFLTALVTSRLKPTTFQGIEKFGIGKYFDVIITADDVTKHKPDPQPALTALKQLGSSPERAVMIGDTKQDILCAGNAGIISVLVDWSMAVPAGSDPKNFRPDYRLKSPEQLINLISTINDKYEK